jgi:hypothetical protein
MSVPNTTTLEAELREIVRDFYRSNDCQDDHFSTGVATGRVLLAEQILCEFFDVIEEELR